MNTPFFRAATLAGVALTTTGSLLVAQAAPPAPAKPAPKASAPKAPVKATPAAKPAVQPIAAKPVVIPGEKLSNGVTYIPAVDRISPRFAASLLLRVGAADETSENAGWRRLVANTLLRRAPRGYGSQAVPSEPGATNPIALEELTRAAQNLGGEIGASVGDDTIEIWVAGDSTNGVKLLQLALDLIRKPILDDADLDKSRERQRDQLDAEDLDVAGRISSALRGQLFRTPSGEVAAYGLPEYGTAASLQNLTNDRLRQLYRSTLLPARLTVAATGDIDVAGMRSVLQGWAPGTTREPTKPTFVPPKPGATPLVVRELPVNSAWVFISYPLGEISPADAPTLRVIAAMLGDARGAKLPTRLLGTPLVQGAPVAISVSTQWLARRYASEILISTQTSSQTVERAKNIVLEEVHKLATKDLTPAELANAKAYALGGWSLERQSLRDRAFSTALSPALGGPYDATLPGRLSAVSVADVKRVAQKYLKNYAVALVMPREN